MSLRVAALQSDLIWEDKEANLKKIQSLLSSVEDVDLVLLPETFSTGFSMRPELFAEGQMERTEEFLCSQAKQKKALIGGSWIERNPIGKPFNTFSIASEEGIIVRYRKINLFTFAGEDQKYSSGHEIISFQYKGFSIVPLICYDLRFPEIFRKMLGSVDLFLVVANWPATRIFAWLSLLKARAIENQSYIIGVNRIGIAGRRERTAHNGYSASFSPSGEEQILDSEMEDILRVNYSLEELTEFRKAFPYLKDVGRLSKQDISVKTVLQ